MARKDELRSVADLRIALRRFSAATDEVTAAHGLTPRQYDLLALLHGRPERTYTPGVIAEELCLSKSASTELLGRASRAGLIVRQVDADNERRKTVTATAEGTRRFMAALDDLRGERTRLLQLLKFAAGLAATLMPTL